MNSSPGARDRNSTATAQARQAQARGLGRGWLGRSLVGFLTVLIGCNRGTPGPARAPASVTRPPAGTVAAPTVVFLGTSLTAGLGLDLEEAYPALIQRKIDSAGFRFRVVNAGVSGESSAGALRRIDWVLREPPALLVVETGANDGLRGQDPDSLRAHIQALVDRTRQLAPGTRLVLAGMAALPNLGAGYAGKFRAVYPDLARKNRIPLIPFLLAGVAGVDSLNQADGIHPNPAGARILADNVWRVLGPKLKDLDRGIDSQ
ncbi:MAG: arylesterase [Gemmatimonadales bacterium]